MTSSQWSRVGSQYAWLLFFALFAGCSSGGSDGGGGAAAPAPTANAGEDETAAVGVPVALDGSASESPTGVPVSYQWTLSEKPAGSTASLINATSVRPAFTPDVAGSYIATLVVQASGVQSEPDAVVITAVTGNVAPRANAGPDASAAPSRPITLDGSASRDPNNTTVTYSWRIVEQPPGSHPTLTNATSAKPTFTADVAGRYVLALACSDGTLTSTVDQVVIIVATGNLPPVANAGPDQTVTTGQLVTLNGTGSTDPNGDPLTYSWCLRGRPEGSTATLNGANTAHPTFTPDVAGSYVLCLTVNDGKAGSASDTVVVEARSPKFNGLLPTTRGPRLQGADRVDGPVAVSADGNTALLGGVDGAWVFTRTGGVWTQQGSKLVGAGGVVTPPLLTGSQGRAVALSADGNTALIGSPDDNGGRGACWVFTRTNGVWTQQGSKLVAGGAAAQPGSLQGASVALTADGNIAAIGGHNDNQGVGAVWIFTRAGAVWTEQTKLIPTDNAGPPFFGISVALTDDGSTLVAGGPDDNKNVNANTGTGAVWVFTRNGNLWMQQGPKLVGTGGLGFIMQGRSVAVSADGNTIVSGGPGDNGSIGASWVFIREADVWRQQGQKLVANDGVFSSLALLLQGFSVAVSDDGNVALIGGPGDGQAGAAWFFTRTNGVWTQQGPKIVNPNPPPQGPPNFGTAVSLNGDATTAVIGDHHGAWVYVP